MRRIVLVACLGFMGCVAGTEEGIGSDQAAYTPEATNVCTTGPKLEYWDGSQKGVKPLTGKNVVLVMADNKDPNLLVAVGVDVGANLVLFRYAFKAAERLKFFAWVEIHDWFDLVGGGRVGGVGPIPPGPGVHDAIFLARARAHLQARDLDEGFCESPVALPQL